eukprot:16220947-Heterocapsa_arctica.AAC.1
MQVMDAENFVNEIYRDIMGEGWRTTAEQRRNVGSHRFYMYERHDIIVYWLELNKLYGTSAYARAALYSAWCLSFAAATNAERINLHCM